MPISLGELDLLQNGNVTNISPDFSQTVQRAKILNAETITTVTEPTERSWTVNGFFRDSVAGNADYDTLNEMLTRGDVYPFSCSRNDYDAPRIAFVKLVGSGFGFPSGHLLNYTIRCFEVPAWGRVSCDTSEDISFLDTVYKKAYREILSPLWHKCGWALDLYTKYFQYDFYIRNDGLTDLSPLLEVQVPDSLDYAQLLYYKDDTDKWQEIGDWGGDDSWGATNNFSDAGAISHNVTLDELSRDEEEAVGLASLRFGCFHRLLILITNLKSDDTGGADAKTKYHSDQLLLRLKVKYLSDVTTWIDSLV